MKFYYSNNILIDKASKSDKTIKEVFLIDVITNCNLFRIIFIIFNLRLNKFIFLIY